MSDPATKPCPFCQEAILASAVKCKHCGEFLDGRARPAPAAAPAPPPKSSGTPIFLILGCVGLGAVVLVGILAAMLLPALAAVKESANRKRCSANLKQISLGFSLYQQKNMDRMPPFAGEGTLQVLHDQGILADPRVYVCPSSDDVPRGGFRTSYASWPRGAIDPARARLEMMPLAWDADRSHHVDVRMVLFADGHVEEVDETSFQPALDRARLEGWLVGG